MNNKINILIADDHQLFRNGFAQLLNSFDEYYVCHESADGQDILNYIAENRVDIITLDLGMPGFPDVSILKAIRKINQSVKILVVSMHDEISLIKQTIRQGADGYITKDTSTNDVKEAIDRLNKNFRYLPRNIAQELAFYEDTMSNSNSLTSREIEILKLIANDGLTLVEIADALKISPKTVTSHKTNIMHKINAKNNAELITLGQKIVQ
jgi:DNA-binding NarL/FixJ family response regulator